jgi:hypothetical protein
MMRNSAFLTQAIFHHLHSSNPAGRASASQCQVFNLKNKVNNRQCLLKDWLLKLLGQAPQQIRLQYIWILNFIIKSSQNGCLSSKKTFSLPAD